MTPGMVDIEQIDAANRDRAQTRAEEGAELARQTGLNAQPRTHSQVTTVPGAILEEGGEVGAHAIVVGSVG
jgi:nucleotide-binding universal stress UspA family protein